MHVEVCMYIIVSTITTTFIKIPLIKLATVDLYDFHAGHNAAVVRFVWQEGQFPMKAGWRCVSIDSGEQCVTITLTK